MKRTKITNYLKLLILFFGVSLLLFNCEKEKLIIETPAESKTLNVTITSFKHLQEIDKKATKLISVYIKGKQTYSKGKSNKYGFTINEEKVQTIKHTNYKTYTFFVERETEQEGVLENYMYKEFNNGSYQQFLLKYYYTFNDENGKVYDKTKMDILEINDSSLLARNSCMPELVQVYNGMKCTNRDRCTMTGNHDVSTRDNCGCNGSNGCYPPIETCVMSFSYEFRGCSGGGSGGPLDTGNNDDPNNDGMNNNTTGGGKNDNNDDKNDNNTTDGLPFDEPEETSYEKVIKCVNGTNLINGPDISMPQSLMDSLRQNPFCSYPLKNFLEEQGCTESNRRFAILASRACLNDNEVDFDLEMIVEITETVAFQNEICLKKIKDDVINTKQITKIIKKFEPENPVLHLEWGIFNNSNYRNTGHTALNSSQTTAFINLNKASLSEVTNIEMVVTIAHEIIHAELYRKLKELVDDLSILTLSEYNTLKDNYPGIADYTLRYGKVEYSQDLMGDVITYGLTPNFSLAHHNQMANFYRKTLIDVMKAYDNQHGNNRGANSEEFYEAISWGGLRNYSENGIINYYDAWKNFKAKIDIDEANIPVSQRTYNKYSTIINQQYDNQGINCD